MSYMLILRHTLEQKNISAMSSAVQLTCESVNHIYYTWFLSKDVNTVFSLKEKVCLQYMLSASH